MTPALLPVAVSLIVVIVASYTDLKKRVVPNRLTYSLIAGGIVFWLLVGLWHLDIWIAVSGFFGASLAFIIGYGVWLARGWGGGDVKMFTALGALLPLYGSAPYPFPLTIFLNSLMIVALIIVPYNLVCYIRKRQIKDTFSFVPILAASTFIGVLFGDLYWKFLTAAGGLP